MGRRACWCVLAAGAALLSGCVERRFVVTTDPPGALVQHNGVPLSSSPADGQFVYYGRHQFTLIHPGHETQQVVADLAPPWYAYPPLDFVVENLLPWTIRDVRRLHFQMQPIGAINSEEVGRRAEELRQRGQGLGGTAP